MMCSNAQFSEKTVRELREMGHRCCSKQKIKRGLWSPEEDEKLLEYITIHGHKSWSSVPKLAGLQRCGKSCRLRWINYLRPDLKRGSFTAEEEQIIIDIHRILGNRWAQIAKHLPGRTDNEVKNFWNSCIKKKLISQGLDPQTHNLLSSHKRSSRNTISHNIHQNSNSIFILSSQNIPNADPLGISQSFSSLPKAPPNIVQTPSAIASSEYRTPNNILSNYKTLDFANELLLTENMSNMCSHSCPNVWVSRFDEAQDFGVQTTPEEGTRVQVQQEKEKSCVEKGVDVIEDSYKDSLEMNGSFESCNFDFGLLESVLASEFISDHDFNYMDEFAWDF